MSSLAQRPGKSRFAAPLRRGAKREFAVGLIAALILTYALVEALAALFGTPGIGSVLLALRELALDGTLSHDLLVTSTRWLVGWVVGAALGLAAGGWTGRSYSARVALERFLTLLRAIPVICLVPLSIRFFGLDEVGKYFVVGWAVFFICWLGAHQSASSLPEHSEWRSRSLRLSRSLWFRAVLAPHVSAAVYTALRTSLLLGLIVTAVAELAGVYERSSGEFWSEGLGYRIFRTLDQARDDQLFATILAFSFLGIVGEALFRAMWNSFEMLVRERRVAETRADLARLATAAAPDRAAAAQESLFQPTPIVVRDLVARYQDSPGAILDRLTLTIPGGTTAAILGRSGSGKTTLIRAISDFSAGALTVSGGIEFDGRKREDVRIGIIPQDAPVFADFTSWQNVLMGDRLRNGSLAQRSAALAAMRQFGLGDSLAAMAGSLSGGQRQRLAFATATLNDPSILLCDEPFSALDAFTRRILQTFYVSQIREKRRLTTLWITHDVDEALIVADAIYVLVAGALIPIDLSSYRTGDVLKNWPDSPAFFRARQNILNVILDKPST